MLKAYKKNFHDAVAITDGQEIECSNIDEKGLKVVWFYQGMESFTEILPVSNDFWNDAYESKIDLGIAINHLGKQNILSMLEEV